MSDLLLKDKLHESKQGDEVRNIAQARTSTILPRLNGIRKGALIRFLYGSNLITDQNDLGPIIKLDNTDLSGAELNYTNLSDANLYGADLSGANLKEASLKNAHLINAILSGINLSLTDLSGANLSGAILKETDLSGPIGLRKTDLRGTTMNNETVLTGIKLQGVEYNTKVIQEKDGQGNPITIKPTRWPQGFDPKAKGAICIDCKTS
jgi:hypothetical protein